MELPCAAKTRIIALGPIHRFSHVHDHDWAGIYEDVDYGRPATSHGVLNYTASATNALWAGKLLDKHRRGEDTSWSSWVNPRVPSQ